MATRTFRVIWRKAPIPQRTLDELALLEEVDAMTTHAFANVAPGPITIEALDDQHRVCWRAYYSRPQDLSRLADLLRGASTDTEPVIA